MLHCLRHRSKEGCPEGLSEHGYLFLCYNITTDLVALSNTLFSPSFEGQKKNGTTSQDPQGL